MSKSAQTQLKSPPEELILEEESKSVQSRLGDTHTRRDTISNLHALFPVSVGRVNEILGNEALKKTLEADEFLPQEVEVLSGKGGTMDPSRVSELVLLAFGSNERFWPADFSAAKLGDTGKFCPEKAYHVSADATVVSFQLLDNGRVNVHRSVGTINAKYGHRFLGMQAIRYVSVLFFLV